RLDDVLQVVVGRYKSTDGLAGDGVVGGNGKHAGLPYLVLLGQRQRYPLDGICDGVALAFYFYVVDKYDGVLGALFNKVSAGRAAVVSDQALNPTNVGARASVCRSHGNGFQPGFFPGILSR